MTMNSIGAIVQAAASAIVGGIVVVVVVGLSQEGGQPPDEAGKAKGGQSYRQNKIEYRTVVQTQEADERRLSALEERIATLEMEPEKLKDPPHTDEEIASQDAETYFRWDQKLQDVANEPRTASFASVASRAYDADFGGLAEQLGFRHLATDCRTSRCRVDFEAEDYAAALNLLPKLVHNRYRFNCAVQVTAPPPEEGEQGPYETSVLFDCSDGE